MVFKKVLNLAESLIQDDTFEFLFPLMKVLDGREYGLCECTRDREMKLSAVAPSCSTA